MKVYSDSEMMFKAIRLGNVEEVQRQVQFHKANVDATDSHGCPACVIAACNGHIEMLELLIKFGVDLNAVEKDSISGFAAIHYAVEKKNLEVLKLLLENGASPNIQNKGMLFTPLHIAARNNFPRAVKILLKFDANDDLLDKYGFNASYWASERGFDNIIQIPKLSAPKAPTISNLCKIDPKLNVVFVSKPSKKKKGKKGKK